MQDNKYLRWFSALIASAVCTAIGMSGALYVYADDVRSCTLKDVAAWQDRLNDPLEEATPAYRLRVSEDFIADCPHRPETRRAHRLAGLAALDEGAAAAAVEHLERGRSPFEPLGMRAWFGLIAAHLELGNETAAWKERDALIAHWLGKIAEDGLAEINSHDVRGGTIHKAEFIALEPDEYVRAVWVAVPDGEGWPSAVVLGSERFRASLFKLRAPEADRLEHIDLIGCQERITLTQSEGRLPVSMADDAAMAAATYYLEQPEMPAANGMTDLSSACVWPTKMLPRPDPYKAVLIEAGP